MNDDDVNVLSIHSEIIENLKKNPTKIKFYNIQLEQLQKIYDKITDNNIKNNIDLLSTNQFYHFYLLEVTPILEQYKKALKKPLQISFTGEILNDNNHKQLLLLKQKYIKIIKKFKYNISPINIKEISNFCSSCTENIIIQIDSNINICSSCGKECDILENTFSYKDTERINIIPKYSYMRRIHFKDCINQFQGKQNRFISQQVYDTLIEKCKIHNLINTNGQTKQEQFQKVTKEHIYLFLKEAGYSKHYEDLKLIFYNLTGTPLCDISHLEQQLMDDFDVLSNLYDQQYIQTNEIKRKNFINTQYVLYQLLKRHKYPCDKDDFNFLKTIERKTFHDEVCSNLFSQLGWNFTNIF